MKRNAMKTFACVVSAVCLLAIVSTSVMAQPGGGGRGPGGGRGGMGMFPNFGGGMDMMFRNEKCQEFIGLSTEQVAKLQAAAEENRARGAAPPRLALN